MRSLVLSTVTRAVFHTILLFGVYLLFAGHNQPGGGFIGGLVAGSAFVLRFVTEGPVAVDRGSRVAPESLLGVGLLAAGGTGAASWLFGNAFLESDYLEAVVPVLGTVKVVSVLAFDVGVFCIVVGLALMLLRSLGGEYEAAPADEAARVRP